MLRAKNFLKDYYNQYPDDKYTDFLKSFGAGQIKKEVATVTKKKTVSCCVMS